MGFRYNLPEKLHKVTNPTYAVDGQEDADNDNDDASTVDGDSEDDCGLTEAQKDDFMALLGDEMDVEIIVEDGEFEDTTDPYVDNELRRLELEEQGRVADRLPINKEFIQSELARLVSNDDGKESTLNGFTRLTEDNAWIPFRMPDSPVEATEIDKEEAAYFNEQEKKYSLKLKTGPKSYKNFAVDWNLEVSRRYKLWSQAGAADLVHLRLKSAAQLEDYYKKREELQSLQRTANAESSEDNVDRDRQLLDTQLRTTRTQLPPRQEPHIVSPPVFIPQANSIMPFAHPAALNASIAMGAVMGTNNHMFMNPRRPMNTPFQMVLPNLPRQQPQRPVRKVFRSKCYCIRCGWRKKEHTVAEGKGKKPEFCTREYCGNCYNMKSHHDKEGIPFGKDCTERTNPFCFTNVNDWWTYSVRTNVSFGIDKLKTTDNGAASSPIRHNWIDCHSIDLFFGLIDKPFNIVERVLSHGTKCMCAVHIEVGFLVSQIELYKPLIEDHIERDRHNIEMLLYHPLHFKGNQIPHKLSLILFDVLFIQERSNAVHHLLVPMVIARLTPPVHVVHHMTQFRWHWLCFSTTNHLQELPIRNAVREDWKVVG
jgi:hypothetical protein